MFIVQATVAKVINYNRKTFVGQAIGHGPDSTKLAFTNKTEHWSLLEIIKH